ncbi:MAG: DUF58 domain-containing protein [Chloroflexi bacterium]|nr:DUF58 domain-containing protein [Chloroflexota bacterium]
MGLIFDAAPLFVPGVAFALLGAVAPAWVWLAARGASIERSLEQDRVVEGEPLEATLVLRAGFLRLPGGEVSEPLAGEPVRAPGGRRTTIRVLARFERRGRRRLAAPALVVRDPLELARSRARSAGAPQDVLVLPATEPVHWARPGSDPADAAASSARADLLAAVEVDGLRPYRRGTPASRIHWPALARGAGLLERRLRVDGDTLPLVVLDARGAAAEEDLDAAVRAAASLTLELARGGGCRLLLPGARRALEVDPDLASWPVAHTKLALVEGGPEARAPSPAALRAALGSLFYVSADRLERLPLAQARESANATRAVLVVPAGLVDGAAARASFTVSGCVGFGATQLTHSRRDARSPSHRGVLAS